MIRDMIQFGTIFAVFLFSFSGAFYLALRGEVKTQMGDVSNITNSSVALNGTDTDTFTSSLDIYPFETS